MRARHVRTFGSLANNLADKPAELPADKSANKPADKPADFLAAIATALTYWRIGNPMQSLRKKMITPTPNHTNMTWCVGAIWRILGGAF